jgi:biopolymer transport protein ExbB/TolQ
LADGNVQGVSENLAIAFSAVVVALISASISYVIYSVRKRWYAKEILDIVEIKNETPIG